MADENDGAITEADLENLPEFGELIDGTKVRLADAAATLPAGLLSEVMVTTATGKRFRPWRFISDGESEDIDAMFPDRD
jgi:hypothetical protein